jgi:hypothetical protein
MAGPSIAARTRGSLTLGQQVAAEPSSFWLWNGLSQDVQFHSGSVLSGTPKLSAAFGSCRSSCPTLTVNQVVNRCRRKRLHRALGVPERRPSLYFRLCRTPMGCRRLWEKITVHKIGCAVYETRREAKEPVNGARKKLPRGSPIIVRVV